MTKPTLILGSSSPARRSLLERLQLPFTVDSPNIDEAAHPEESTRDTVARLAKQKAQTVAKRHNNALIIACDQLVQVGDQPLGKPHTHDNATQQLQLCSNQTLHSLTALCVFNTQTKSMQQAVIDFNVHFKPLSDAVIEQYLQIEQPYHCAGSIRAEGLGITLFQSMQGDDPTALIGLPLITLTTFLTNESFHPIINASIQHKD